MSQRLFRSSSPARVFLPALLVLGLCGCQTAGIEDVTGALGGKSEKSRAGEARAEAKSDLDGLRETYRARQGDPEIALAYGKALRESGQRSQAVAVLEQAVLNHSKNKALLAAYGRALADNGNFQQAFDVLTKAHSPEDPDWRILSAQGAVLDQMGRNEEAQQYYASALKIRPDEPSVLSNLGLSYVLQNNLPKAEQTLGRAYQRNSHDARVRANLALVLGLQGRQAEAEVLVKADLPPDEAAAKVNALREMLAKKQQRADR
ncbi:tetratricopeptide repeat protein [Bradyrhizobium liaoningense]|uniref:tetratricopeptide repeat protein n=1 Tax=Bradyrhizobium liaoningense TaxID=43992 RepID=UPI001BA525A8|nr:tetratricopeptide repeat protein [Bradyrhizobium liaoningense]MBR0715263.1 tetratricopeptide repeat protein [Bradyrhizobium liaoningense]